MSKRVAFASSDGVNVDLHFAKASSFYIYEIDNDSFEYVGHRKQDALSKHDEDGFSETLKLIGDCKSVVVSQIGMGALAFVNSRGFRVFEASYPIEAILQKFIEKNILKEG
ncbi:MAG TPA: NifB/NifX family molybdenum-iron cluster-binding protein [Ruminiclostridium sp.]|nr:NifB/NifX family molybdenum-iron cluster-binding protein [Ruminiclostridium sp.]